MVTLPDLRPALPLALVALPLVLQLALAQTDPLETWHQVSPQRAGDWVARGGGVGASFSPNAPGEEVQTPLDAWAWRNPLPQGNPLYAITYGDGQFVAVGGYDDEAGSMAVIATSPDGTAWRVRAQGTLGMLRGVAYGYGRFVAVGNSKVRSPGSVEWADLILTSADGEIWTPQSLGTGNTFYAVTYGNGRFVAVGYGWAGGYSFATAITSTDGVTWDSHPMRPTSLDNLGNPYAVAYGGGIFVAVGDNGRVFTSTDGADWTPQSSGMAGTLQGVVYGDGKFVAVGLSYAGSPYLVYTSEDGSTWNSCAPGGIDVLNGITYGSGVFVAVGYLGAGVATTGRIIASTDGTSWTPQADSSDWIYAAAYGNGTFVATGEAGAVLSSPDGLAWTPQSGASAWLYGVACGNGALVAVGEDGTILTSGDGRRWTPQPSGTTETLRAVTYGNGTFVAVGDAGMILASADGSTWAAMPAGTAQTLRGVTCGDGTFVAVGTWGTILYSTDGETWLPGTSGTTAPFSAVSYGGGAFVAVGGGFQGDGSSGWWDTVVFTSTGAVTWTPRNAHLGVPWSHWLQGVAYGSSGFVAVGTAGDDELYGSILFSADGTTWTPIMASQSGWDNLDETYAIAYGDGQFVVTGARGAQGSNRRGVTLVSSDGTTWTAVSSGTLNRLDAVTYGNGHFTAVGYGGTILRSARALRIAHAGTGSGTVTSADPPIDCSSDFTWPCDPGTRVTLTATATEGSAFVGWEGADEVNGNQCTVTLAASRTVTATFVPTVVTHTVTFHPGAHGTLAGGTPEVAVTVNDGAPAPSTPAVTPAPGWSFTGWLPALPATIVADVETTAQYEAVTCTVTFAFTGNGALTGTLVQTVPYGGSTTPVTAAPGADSYFRQWSDGSTDNPRTIDSVTADLALTAEFLPLVEGDPDGHFELVYQDQANPGPRRIWDLTGHYATVVKAYTLTLDLTEDEKGTLGGTGRFQGTVGGQAFDAGNLALKGKAKGKAGVVTVKGGLAGGNTSTSVSLKLAFTLDGAARRLNGTLTGSVSDTVGGKAAISATCALDLPAGMDGTYRLPVDLILDAGKGTIAGTGTLTLSNGRTVALLVKGKRSGGVTSLRLAGDKLAGPAFAAVKLKLAIRTYAHGEAYIQAMAGKAFGQSLKWP